MRLRTTVLTSAWSAVVLTNVLCLQGQTIGSSKSMLISPFRTAIISTAAPDGFTAPVFASGYIVRFKRHLNIRQPNVYLYNSRGVLEHAISIWPVGAKTLALASVDVGRSKRLAFSGWFSVGNNRMTTFIGFADLDGTNSKYVFTGNYLATQIALASDGSVWVIGTEEAEVVAGQERWNNYDTLRHYSTDGVLLEHYLPRWEADTAYVIRTNNDPNNKILSGYDTKNNLVKSYGPPFWGPHGGYNNPSSISSQSWLRVVRDEIVFYDGRNATLYRAGGASHSPLSSHGVDKRYLNGATISGFTVSSDGTIYASMVSSDAAHSSRLGIFELLINPSGGLSQWSRVRAADGAAGHPIQNPPPTVLGSDGTAIVYSTIPGLVNWSTLQ